MSCSNCGNHSDASERFCRRCGASFKTAAPASDRNELWITKSVVQDSTLARLKDPDELTSNGIGSVIMGDGLLMVAVILSATDTSVSSLLWLLLLIPAFFFFGKGFSDVLKAKQIRARLKQNELASLTAAGLSPPPASVIDVIKRHTTGELLPRPSVAERTTRQLE